MRNSPSTASTLSRFTLRPMLGECAPAGGPARGAGVDGCIRGTTGYARASPSTCAVSDAVEKVTSRDGFDPDGGSPVTESAESSGPARENTAGIYGTVTRIGRLPVGQTVLLRRQ